MKVHPAPKKRNITFRYDISPSLSAVETFLARQKKLRRLPHIFSKVLELPCGSDVDVDVQEDVGCFQFVVATDDVGDGVRAHTVEIQPGVTKVVIREGTGGGSGAVLELPLEDLELDLWRFRLPPSTRPELASAVYVDGELIVTIPKRGGFSDSGEEGEGGEGEVWGEQNGNINGGGMGQLVLVQ